MGRRSLLAAIALALGLALGCTSPTLPLPPPSAPSILAGSTPDTVTLTSLNGVEPNALVLVVNRNLDLPRSQRVSATLADEQGSWELEVFAVAGDLLDISQESGTTRSPSTTVQVR
jgi:hypothetical protein